MENPVSTIKSAFNVSFILRLIVGFIILNALLEFTGLDGWIYSPVATFKSKFGGGS